MEVWQIPFYLMESGQGQVEHALILVLVAVVFIVILTLLGPTNDSVCPAVVEVI
jgi:hypothetical protein